MTPRTVDTVVPAVKRQDPLRERGKSELAMNVRFIESILQRWVPISLAHSRQRALERACAAYSRAGAMEDEDFTAREHHLRMMRKFLESKGPSASDLLSRVQGDFDALQAAHRFIRTPADDADDTSASRMAKRYYDKLYREYCLADMRGYKEGNVGMRWRTEPEVVTGKGHLVCGNLACDERRSLTSFEVPFGYVEAGVKKQALVKLRLCPECAYKLHYRRIKRMRATAAEPCSARSPLPSVGRLPGMRCAAAAQFKMRTCRERRCTCHCRARKATRRAKATGGMRRAGAGDQMPRRGHVGSKGSALGVGREGKGSAHGVGRGMGREVMEKAPVGGQAVGGRRFEGGGGTRANT